LVPWTDLLLRQIAPPLLSLSAEPRTLGDVKDAYLGEARELAARSMAQVAQTGLTPDMLSLSGVALSAAAAVSLYFVDRAWWLYLVAAALFVLSGLVPSASPLILVCWVLAGIVALVALYKTVTAWFHRWTTETDVTNFRVVHKTGFIQRQTFEMSVDKVESVDVTQTTLGRIFGYGSPLLGYRFWQYVDVDPAYRPKVK